MRMLHITQLNDLVANSMNILEPSPTGDDGDPREDGIHLFPFTCYFCSSFIYWSEKQNEGFPVMILGSKMKDLASTK